MLIKILLFFCYCFSSKSILLSLAPFSLGQAIQINFEKKRKREEKQTSNRRKKHKGVDSEKKDTESDKKLIQSNKEKPYPCDLCPKTLSSISNLKIHKKTQHKNDTDVPQENPHKCDACPKRFDRISRLISHKRSHTGEKPFECDLCPIRFSQNSNLTQHKKLFHNDKLDVLPKSDKQSIQSNKEKPYPCDLCPISFTRIGHLVSHKRTHTGDQPFECDVCHERFSQKSNCNRHKKRKHKKESDVPQEETQAEQEANSTRMEDTSEWNVEKIAECLAHCNQENPFSFEGSNNILGKEA